MKKVDGAQEWFKRAKSNMAFVRAGKISPDILYEDLCFEAQQATEKALKALCITHKIIFPKTHNIEYLMELLEKQKIFIPHEVQMARLLTDYAVATRYPGGYEPVSKQDYEKASKIAELVLSWVEENLGKTKSRTKRKKV